MSGHWEPSAVYTILEEDQLTGILASLSIFGIVRSASAGGSEAPAYSLGANVSLTAAATVSAAVGLGKDGRTTARRNGRGSGLSDGEKKEVSRAHRGNNNRKMTYVNFLRTSALDVRAE